MGNKLRTMKYLGLFPFFTVVNIHEAISPVNSSLKFEITFSLLCNLAWPPAQSPALASRMLADNNQAGWPWPAVERYL